MTDDELVALVDRTLTAAAERARQTLARKRRRRRMAVKRTRRAVAPLLRGASRDQLERAYVAAAIRLIAAQRRLDEAATLRNDVIARRNAAASLARLSADENLVAMSMSEVARQLGLAHGYKKGNVDKGRKKVERLIAKGILYARPIPGCHRHFFDRRQLAQLRASQS